MKTKNIFKTLALATMMPAMLLTTACSSDDDAVNNEINNNGKGYALPVTINVTRGDGSTTRATYNEGTKTLAFSSGDQLFVKGTDGTAGAFAGTLTWVSDDTFSGTIYTENSYTGTADALLTSASTATATLLPDGYGSIGYLTVSGDGYSASLTTDATNAFATSKAAAVEQLSLEQASAYSDGFALAPQNAILNFTVTGLTAGTPTAVSLTAGSTSISGSVTPVEVDYRATATFAMAVAHSATASSLTLTVDGTAVSLGSHTLTAGKIYSQKLNNINGASPYIQNNEKWIVYGTGEPSGCRLTIAEGATVTLHNVNLSDASIVCMGSNTIILAEGTTNSVTDAGHIGGPAIMYMGGDGTTLTITGTGTLNVTGGYDNPAIGPMSGSCGNITIANTVTLTATAGTGQSKAITTGTGGGTVTIGGVVYADGTGTPFIYPIPAPTSPYASLTAEDVGKIIGADGNVYANADAVAAGGTTALALIAYVGAAGSADASSATYKGLGLALTDANSGAKCAWCPQSAATCMGNLYDASTKTNDMAGIANTNYLIDSAPDGHTHAAATAARNYNSGTHPTGTSAWFLPSAGQWDKMIDAAGGYATLKSNASLSQYCVCWSSTENEAGKAWAYEFYDNSGGWYNYPKYYGNYVRAVFAF